MTYVLELEGDAPGWEALYSGTSVYSGGRVFVGGKPSDADLWFREGITVPEPGELTLAGLGVLGMFLGARVSRLRAGRLVFDQAE